MWDAETGKEQERLVDGEKNDSRRIDQIQLSPDASLLYLVTGERLFINKCSVAKENRIFLGLGCGVKWFGVNPAGITYLGTNDAGTALMMVKDPFDEDARDKLLRTSHTHSGPIDLLAGVGDSAVVTVAGGVLRRWKADSDEPVWEQKLDEKAQPAHLSVGAGGTIVAVADKGGGVHLFSAETGKAAGTLSGHTGPVRAVAFNPNGKQVVTGGEDKTARVWDAKSGKELAQLEGHTKAVTGVGFSPGGDMIVTGCADKTARIWAFTK
ncbi:WD40 repeat domain-containing protein [Frigoriglobus tundricola]|uniref:High-affnity carbon uptake protein Hat/HatR n=1 Tax=Frigoriglobus tundricola TaxID=2774151 RepID=A0A6M5YXP4_9BACT|nr:WD40 repeat domain-containing protein [Frigoriglobus tundricola]QJW98755.1 High-affnity carbon uptake protein Hat/HatR [Frigoriglobus tundricola]